MRRLSVRPIIYVAMALTLAGCTQSLEQAAQDAERVAEQGAEQLAEGLRGMTEDLANIAESGRSPVDPIDFRQLQQLFPDIDDWNKGSLSGQQMSSPVAYAEAEITYTNDEAHVEVSIVDSAFHGLLLTPVSMLVKTGFEHEDEFGYQRSVDIGGTPGWETWDSRDRTAELTGLLNGRFLLTLEGRMLKTPDVLRQIVLGIDHRHLPTAGSGEDAVTKQ